MPSIQINIGDHTSRMTGYIAFPTRYRKDMNWVRTKAKWITRNKPSADVYFKSLSEGNSLRKLLADSSIWINYHATMTYFGETEYVGGKEIAISDAACRWGRWTMLATLVHELAHANGAAGGSSHAAELALIHCGLGKKSEHRSGTDDPNTPYDPNISG